MEKKMIDVSKCIKYQGRPIILEIGPCIICITLRSLWENGTAFYVQGDGCVLLEINHEKAQHAHLVIDHDTLPIPVYKGGVTTVATFFFDNTSCIVRELTQEEYKTYKSALHLLMHKTKKPYVDVIPFSRPSCGFTRVF